MLSSSARSLQMFSRIGTAAAFSTAGRALAAPRLAVRSARPAAAARVCSLGTAPLLRAPPAAACAPTALLRSEPRCFLSSTPEPKKEPTPAAGEEQLPPGPPMFRFIDHWRGVNGSRAFRGEAARKLEAKNPLFAKLNSFLFLAPAWKWGLAIVPLYGIVIGVPAVENLDLNQSLALMFTGCVWAYYSLLVRPAALMLCAVNCALLVVNGYNVYRKWNYDRALAAQEKQ